MAIEAREVMRVDPNVRSSSTGQYSRVSVAPAASAPMTLAMSEKLRLALEALQRHPPHIQNKIALHILEELEEEEWDAIVSKPRVKRRLAELADEALEEYRQGKVRDGGFGLD